MGFERVPNIADFSAIDDFDAPEILRRHRHVVIDVAAHFLFGRWQRSRHVMRVQITQSDTVNQLHYVAVFNLIQRWSHVQIIPTAFKHIRYLPTT